MRYTIETIATIIRADSRSVITNREVSVLLTDSRSLSDPSRSLFFAIVTEKNDGTKYVTSLYNKGVRAFVVSNASFDVSSMPDASFLFVKNSLRALQRLAEHHRQQFSIPIIGITGSNGKTVVKEWLFQLLHKDLTITRSPRSYNSQIGVPLSVWRLDSSSQMGIFEAGISTVGEMALLFPIIRPTIGILTNIGLAHQVGFESLQQKCLEKIGLFSRSELLIYNADNPLICDCIVKSGIFVKEIGWSKVDKERPLYISDISKTVDSSTIAYSYLGINGCFTIPFSDEASIENAIHCLVVLLYCNVPSEEIAERMSLLQNVAMRLEVKEGINDCIVINDTCTSDMQSLDIALDFMSRRNVGLNLKKTLIISDILQSGLLSKSLYKTVANMLVNYKIDHLIGIGKDISCLTSLFSSIKERAFYQSTEEFLESGAIAKFSNELILLKGSNIFHFEDISERIERKVHETILEVNIDALIHNFNYYRSLLRPSTKMICMVKAFGYGAGSLDICSALQENGCNYLAVATADEGMELRKAGIYIPIIVMNPEFGSLYTLFNYGLEPEVYSLKMLNDLLTIANKYAVERFPIHIKLNTGMNRLGFTHDQLPALIDRLTSQQTLSVSTLFSHLYAADNPAMDVNTYEQIDRFEKYAQEIEQGLGRRIDKHLLNTAGIVRFTEKQFDLVRLGIGLYGIPTVGEPLLRNVTTLKTNILQIQTVDAGESIGYGGIHRVDKPSRIAVIPIGYGDGLSRRLSNGVGKVFIKGVLVPIVGNICMDITMIDVSDVPNVCEGNTVVIFGEDNPVTELSSALETIPYEILTAVSSRVKRIYIKE